MNEYQPHAYYLFVKPSFGQGLGRIWDFRGRLSMYNISSTPAEADAKALASDWLAVGQDLKEAMKQTIDKSIQQYERTK